MIIFSYLKITFVKKKGKYFKNRLSALIAPPFVVISGDIFKSNNVLTIEAIEKNMDTMGMDGRHSWKYDMKMFFFE